MRTCQICSKPFETRPGLIAQSNCSKRCARIAFGAITNMHMKNGKKTKVTGIVQAQLNSYPGAVSASPVKVSSIGYL